MSSQQNAFDTVNHDVIIRIYCKNIHVDDVVKCSDVNCKSYDHLKQLDDLYLQLCSVLKHASNDSILASKMCTHHDYIVPGCLGFPRECSLRSEKFRKSRKFSCLNYRNTN